MSLLKAIEAASGVSGNYWKITKVIHHRAIGKTEIELQVFKDADSAGENKSPVAGIARQTRWMDDESAEGASVEDCYAAVKAQAAAEETDNNYFADAEDV